MTIRQMYEGVLFEIHKENAPNITLEQFNYMANKAVRQYVNKKYNIYDINQQSTDDLGVLKANAMLTPYKSDTYEGMGKAMEATYYVTLPSDYLHVLNCICYYDVHQTHECYDRGDIARAPARRLTADAFSQVLDNFWNCPKYNRPYYYIHNVNVSTINPTNPYDSDPKDNSEHGGTDVNPDAEETITIDKETVQDLDGNGNLIAHVTGGTPKTIRLRTSDTESKEFSAVEKTAGIRYGKETRCEIRYGTDTDVFTLKGVYIDYIKAPQHIRLTQTQLDHTEDMSQMLEFPEYVCQEILNELVIIIMENIMDQRVQTFPVVSQSIANPAQQQTEPVAQATQ